MSTLSQEARHMKLEQEEYENFKTIYAWLEEIHNTRRYDQLPQIISTLGINLRQINFHNTGRRSIE